MVLLKVLGYILMIAMELVFAYMIIRAGKNIWAGIKEKSSITVVWHTVVLIMSFALFLWICHPRMLEDLFGWKL